MNSSLRQLLIGCSVIAFALHGRTSYAIVIASDSFEYATGNLAGQNGGVGFTAAYTSSGGTAQVQTPGLTFPLLNTVGNKVFISASNQNWRALTAGMQGTGDSTVWISFIGQRTGANNIRFFGISFYGGDVNTSANEHLTIGENSNNSNDTWGAHFSSAVAGRIEVSGASINTQTLLLARINFHAAGNDDFYMWVNPNLASGEPPIVTAGASSVGLFTMAFDRVSLRASTSNGGNIGEAVYDELRIGTNFADVTPGVCGLGDVNCDGTVDLQNDFEAIRSHFRKSVTLRSDGDLVSNGVVDFADFQQWKTAFLGAGGSLDGVSLSFFETPEPSVIGLLVITAFIFGCWPRCPRLPSSI